MKSSLKIDLHGYTSNEARDFLNSEWASRRWEGLRRVVIIHGTGDVLWRVVREWAGENGIPWATDPNPGIIILHPFLHAFPVDIPRKPQKVSHLRQSLEHLKIDPPAPPKPVSPAEKKSLKKDKELEQMKEAFDLLANMNEDEINRQKYR